MISEAYQAWQKKLDKLDKDNVEAAKPKHFTVALTRPLTGDEGAEKDSKESLRNAKKNEKKEQAERLKRIEDGIEEIDVDAPIKLPTSLLRHILR